MGAAMRTGAMETGELAKTSPHKEIYLHPGQTHISVEPVQISMILGSCAGVCLYDRRQAIGGANHYMLSPWDGPGVPSSRYWGVAPRILLKEFQALLSGPNPLVAQDFW